MQRKIVLERGNKQNTYYINNSLHINEISDSVTHNNAFFFSISFLRATLKGTNNMSINLLTYSNNGSLLSISCVGLQADPDSWESGTASTASLLQPGCTSLLSLSFGVTTGELAFLVPKENVCVKRLTLYFICTVFKYKTTV